MKIILASSNKGKVKEIKDILSGYEVIPYTDLIEKFEIEENGKTFKENAIIKAKNVAKKLPGYIVMADDSGISVPALGGVPGIYSARFAGDGASDKDNLYKLIEELKKRGIKKTPAFYTAAIAITSFAYFQEDIACNNSCSNPKNSTTKNIKRVVHSQVNSTVANKNSPEKH
jgi:XTP/dITP diphosphohydrolase